MAVNSVGEEQTGALRLQFDRTVKLAFGGSSISSDGGLLLHRELNDALGLSGLAAGIIVNPRVRKDGRHHLTGLLRQSIFSRLAGHQDVNDADRLRRDPVMRRLVGGRAMPPSPSRHYSTCWRPRAGTTRSGSRPTPS